METNRKGETPMAVFRVEKTRNYTVMSNHPLRDKSLSLKAKGLLSLMLSLPEEWDYTTKGLAYICKDGVDSIESTGIAEPLIVRPRSGGGYEIISGHRRDYCAKVVGLETRPVIVRDYSDEDADVLVVDYNINRENLLPSEKAKAYKLKLDAMRRTAGRPAKNSGQLGQNFQGRASVDILAEQADESRKQVQRYIRLTNLIPLLMEAVDTGKLKFVPAADYISHLTEKEQTYLQFLMERDERYRPLWIRPSGSSRSARRASWRTTSSTASCGRKSRRSTR